MIKYLCGVTFDWELPELKDPELYDSIDELKRVGDCWKQCGIVEIEYEDGKDPQEYHSHKWIEERKPFSSGLKDNKESGQ